jgi:thioredoxin 1
MLEVNDTNFEKEVIEASKTKPVLVDFYAQWCGTCKMMEPVYEELARDVGDRVIFAKSDAETAPIVTEKIEVLSLPSFALFKEGKFADMVGGAQAKEILLEFLK